MGLIGGIARTAIAAGTWTAVSNGVSRRQANRWAAEDQSHSQAQSAPPAYMPPPPGRYQRQMFQQGHEQAPAGAQPVYLQPVYVQPHSPAAPVADAMTARLAQLQQLGALKAQGILSDVEFEAQKSKILNS